MRACIQHKLFAEYPQLKLFYIGQNFRYERGQKGRYRQHQQLGIEAFGASDAAIDAEVILLAMAFFREAGITDQELHINSVRLNEPIPISWADCEAIESILGFHEAVCIQKMAHEAITPIS